MEGIDGSGKSSHISWLADEFRKQGKTVVITREPGGTPLAEKIRELLLHEPMTALTEALLFNASRKEHLVNIIYPALERGEYVITDRYYDSNYAYQCGGRGLDEPILDTLTEMVDAHIPDLTLLFDVNIDIAKERMGNRELDKFELEKADFHQRIRNRYLGLARRVHNEERIKVIDASKSIIEIREILSKIIEGLS